MGQNCCKEEEDVPITPQKNRTHTDSLQRRLVREYHRDFREVYTVVGLIGEGSISNIYKIRKVRTRQRSSSSFRHSIKRSSSLFRTSLKQKRSRTVTGEDYALKEIDTKFVKEECVDELRNEIELLKGLDHPNIIKLYETFYYRKKLSMVIELCTGGDLYGRNPYTEVQAADITKQILSAINFMHKQSIIHRDVKHENIMFVSSNPNDWTVKLIDFGLARVYTKRMMTSRVGTLYTMAPETIEGIYNSKADIWSVGVVVFQLLSGLKPFWGKTRSIVTKQILKADYNFDEEVWNDRSAQGRAFVSSLLQIDQRKRLSAEQALNHPWLCSETSLSDRTPDLEAMKSAQARLVQFAESGEFRKLVMQVIAKRATTEDILGLREIFNNFDSNNDGTITFKEFKMALAQSGFSDEDIQSIFRKLDVNGNNVLMYTEFIASLLEIRGWIDEAKLEIAFEQLDVDGSGSINEHDLKVILGKTGSSNAYVKRLIEEADLDSDGQISFDEFKQYLMKKNVEHVHCSLELVA